LQIHSATVASIFQTVQEVGATILTALKKKRSAGMLLQAKLKMMTKESGGTRQLQLMTNERKR
jgi:hypothetical protein